MNVILPGDVGITDRRAQSEYLIPTLLLMEHAAGALAEAAAKKQGKILVVCGTGGNGGDGFAAARMLHLNRRSVAILFPFHENNLSGNTKLNHDIIQKLGIKLYRDINEVDLASYSIIIDCLLGTGITRNISGQLADIIDLINKCPAYKIAADIPSGIHGQTGQVMGYAIICNETITFSYEKMGLLLYPGREYAGRVSIANIGIPEQLINTDNIFHYTPYEIAQMLPKRRKNSYKGNYGHILIIAGSRGFMGAGALCSRGSVLGGAGLVTWAYPEGESANPPLEAMTFTLPSSEGKISVGQSCDIIRRIAENKTCIAIGPGLGTEPAHELLKILVGQNKPMVIDADAISALALYETLPRFSSPCIITPHPGEMARILHTETAYVVGNPVECTEELAAKANAVVILKMATSIIASPEEKICFNTTGNPGMATGGSGDVLTGICAALLARSGDAYASAVCAAFIHGQAGDIAAATLGEDSMGSSDIANFVGESYKTLLQYQMTRN